MSKKDMDAVLSDGINLAMHFLKRSQEFYPFGVVMTADGRIRHIEASSPHSGRPKSEHIRAMLHKTLQADFADSKCRAAAVISDVLLREHDGATAIDAIRAEVYDLGGQRATCYAPYVVVGKDVTVGELRAEPGLPLDFA